MAERTSSQKYATNSYTDTKTDTGKPDQLGYNSTSVTASNAVQRALFYRKVKQGCGRPNCKHSICVVAQLGEVSRCADGTILYDTRTSHK